MSCKIQVVIILLLSIAIVAACGILGAILYRNNQEKVSPPISTDVDTEILLPEKIGMEKESYQIDISPYREAIESRGAEFMILVNATHPYGTTVPNNIVYSDGQDQYDFSGYAIERTTLSALTAMCLEAKAEGIENLDLTSAYRSYEKQTALFYGYCDNEKLKDPSLTQKDAEKIVETYSCRPGTSEHQTGLAVDLWVNTDRETLLEESFGETEAGRWLAENCHKFGFVLRFPKDKTEITKIQYEPWHFRFVGYYAACEMKENGMCLEEYVAHLEKNRTL